MAKKTTKTQKPLADTEGPIIKKCPPKLKKFLTEMYEAKSEAGEHNSIANDRETMAVEYMIENEIDKVCIDLPGGNQKNFEVKFNKTIKSSKPKKPKEDKEEQQFANAPE